MSKPLPLFALKYLAVVVIGILVFAAPKSSFAAGFSTKAKLALIQNGEGTINSKGVNAVTNPSTGLYCVTPASKLNFNAIYPEVTIEWGNSSGEQLLAFWYDQGTDCSATEIEVLTYDFSSGSAVLSDNVAFILTVQ